MSKKTIVVVGAGQGLGNHVAERFAKENFRVVLVAAGVRLWLSIRKTSRPKATRRVL